MRKYQVLDNKKVNIKVHFFVLEILYRGLVRGVSGVSIDTPRILSISTAAPQVQSVRMSKIGLTPLDEIPNEASALLS